MAIDARFNATIDADISKFMKKAATVDKTIKQMATGVIVDIGADISNFMRRAATVEATVEHLASAEPTITVDANTAGFMAQAAAVEAAATAIGSAEPTVTVDADTTAATVQVTTMMARLRAITARNLIVRVQASWNNYQAVMGQMASFSRNIGEIVGITTRGGLMVIAPAAVPVIASVVGLIGNLGPMLGTVAGSTFALGSAFGTAGIGAAAFGAIAVTNLKDIFGASTELKELNEKLAKADTWKEQLKIQKEIKRVQGSLNEEQTKGLDAINKLKKTWSGIAGSLQAQTIQIFTKALGIMSGVLTTLKPLFSTVMDAANGLIDSLGKSINSKPMQAFFDYLNKNAAPMLTTITEAVGYFMQGLFNMMTAFGPLATETAEGFRNMGQGFAEWSEGLSKSDKFQSFVSYVSENMPKIRSIFSDAIQGMINMFGGFSGTSSDMMTSLQNLMERFKNFSSTISENKGFQNFLDYFKTNGPVVVSAIGEIITLLVNFGIALAPMGQKILGMVDSFTNWSNGMMTAHPWLGKLAAGALLVVGGLTALAPAVFLTNALFGGLIITMIKTVAKMTWAAVTMVAKWLWMATQATVHAIRVGAAWAWTTGVQMVTALAKMAASAAIFVAKWLWMGVQAGLHAIKVAAAWTLSTGIAMVTAVAKMTATAAVFVAKWVWMGVQSLLQAARMAAAWFIALGPIGWVAGAIVGIVALVILNWDKVSAWTAKAWSAISSFVVNAVSKIAGWVQSKFPALYNVIASYMNMAKSIISTVWNGIKATFSNVLSFLKALVKGDFQGMRNAIQSQMNLAKSTIQQIWGAIKSYLSTLLGTLVSTFSSMFSKIVSTIRSKTSEAVSTLRSKVGEMPGAVRAFAGAMLSAGADLVRGLINGIKNMGGAAVEAITGVVGGLVSKAKSLLKIKSPSRVFMEIGDFVGQGLAKGVTGTAKQVAAAGATLASKLTKAMTDKKTTKMQRAALQSTKTFANGQIKILTDLAKKREALATKIKTASQKLADAVKVRDDFAKSVADNAKSFASISNMEGKTGGDFAAQMNQRLKAIQEFQANIKRLQKAGLNKTTLQDLINAGVDGGGDKAKVLAGSSTAIINQINGTQTAINKASSALGKDAANEFYGLGVDAAKGIVKGLESQAKALEVSANKISDTLVKAVKKRLNIHSPSRVFAELGGFVSEGLAVGVGDKAKAAITSVGSMAAAMTGAFNPQLAMADMRASAQLDTSIKRNDMKAVRHSFAAEVGSFEFDQPDMYLVVDGKELGKVVAGPVKEKNERYENMLKVGRGRR